MGIDLYADRLPLREADMEPWEIMISAKAKSHARDRGAGEWEAAKAVCDRWDLTPRSWGRSPAPNVCRSFTVERWLAIWMLRPWPNLYL